MGMYDEIYCDAALPDDCESPGACFQTKSFPDPFYVAIESLALGG